MARYPVDSINIASGYGTRTIDGKLQNHYAFDLAGVEGTEVKAPEAGLVVAVWTDNNPPWQGYGPGGVEIRGESGAHHVLAHVTPTVGTGVQVAEGEVVGTMVAKVGKAGPHVHWEVRKQPLDSPETRGANTVSPDAWMVQTSTTGRVQFPAGKSNALVWLVLLFLIARR